jgi:hypothetical protein
MRNKVQSILIVVNILLLAAMLLGAAYYEGIFVTRPAGAAFFASMTGMTDCAWRVQVNGVQVWCVPPGKLDAENGAAFAGFGPILTEDGRVLFEFNSSSINRRPVGIVLNNPDGSAISLTSEDGCLVIRDERQGADHILGVYGNCE